MSASYDRLAAAAAPVVIAVVAVVAAVVVIAVVVVVAVTVVTVRSRPSKLTFPFYSSVQKRKKLPPRFSGTKISTVTVRQ